MLLIQDKLVSEELFANEFVCNLKSCKGECCVAGDIGAPLAKNELKILEEIAPEVSPYLPAKARKWIAKKGAWVDEGEYGFATPLIEGNECVYTVFENGIAKCGIEKAYNDGKIKFKKPVSCHLYPIRIAKVGKTYALNYDRWSICKAACTLGKKLKVPVYRFLKDAIIRKYGKKFYEEMDEVAGEYVKS